MMPLIKVLGIDPSLRHTGLAVLEYDSDTKILQKPSRCMVIDNPQKFTGSEAILNMLDLLTDYKKDYDDIDHVVIESPAALFNAKFPASSLITIGHISGGAVCIFGIQKSFLVRPVEWNRNRKKEVTHRKLEEIFGNAQEWNFYKKIKSEKNLEHVFDAVGMAYYWIKLMHMDEETD
jgi:Holliday junction resolvasome RuvABC endonuclease subunit